MSRQLRGGTFNLRVTRSPRTVADECARLCKRHNLDFLTVQESDRYIAALHGIPGYRVVTGTRAKPGAQREVAILVRASLPTSHVVARAYGDGWFGLMARRRMRPRIFLAVTIDGWLRVACVHLPASVTLHDNGTATPRDRGQDFIALIRRVERFLRIRGKARLVAGDWNQSSANNKPNSPRQAARKTGATVAAPDRGIDYALAKRCHVTGITKDRTIQESSDHEPVVFTVLEAR